MTSNIPTPGTPIEPPATPTYAPPPTAPAAAPTDPTAPAPQYAQPGAPQYAQPGAPQYAPPGAPQYAPPPYGAYPPGTAYGYPPPVDPGRTLGIVGLIFSFLMPLIGLILSIVARSSSKRVGINNTMAKAGIWISSILLAIGVIVAVVAITWVIRTCNDLGPGTHFINGVRITCGR